MPELSDKRWTILSLRTTEPHCMLRSVKDPVDERINRRRMTSALSEIEHACKNTKGRVGGNVALAVGHT